MNSQVVTPITALQIDPYTREKSREGGLREMQFSPENFQTIFSSFISHIFYFSAQTFTSICLRENVCILGNGKRLFFFFARKYLKRVSFGLLVVSLYDSRYTHRISDDSIYIYIVTYLSYKL